MNEDVHTTHASQGWHFRDRDCMTSSFWLWCAALRFIQMYNVARISAGERLFAGGYNLFYCTYNSQIIKSLCFSKLCCFDLVTLNNNPFKPSINTTPKPSPNITAKLPYSQTWTFNPLKFNSKMDLDVNPGLFTFSASNGEGSKFLLQHFMLFHNCPGGIRTTALVYFFLYF